MSAPSLNLAVDPAHAIVSAARARSSACAAAITDAALVAAVAADHRRAAFDTCSRLVDAVKDRIPVWKHQFFGDGSDEWVNSA